METNRTLGIVNRHKAAISFAALIGLTLFYLLHQTPLLGASDRGRLFLAGATELLGGEAYTITQRPPFFSVVLGGLGWIAGKSPQPTSPAALEFGNIHWREVADELVEPSFLRLIVFLQILLWLGTAYLTWLILREIQAPAWLADLSPLFFLLPMFWAPVPVVHDVVLTQFLIVAGVFLFVRGVHKEFEFKRLSLAAVMFSLAALTRATFQLLPLLMLVVAAILAVLAGKTGRLGGITAALLLPFILLVAGWSGRNYVREGFFGVSSVMGPALGIKTATYMERAAPAFPREAKIFEEVRDETFLKSSENVPNFWAASAAHWLMKNENYSYVEASKFMAKYNFHAIIRAPSRYLQSVGKSVVSFLWPSTHEFSFPVRLGFFALEFLVLGVFLILLMVWFGLHLSRFLLPFMRHLEPHSTDRTLVAFAAIFGYTLVISCCTDAGRFEHRDSVQFLVPLIGIAVFSRMRSACLAPTREVDFKSAVDAIPFSPRLNEGRINQRVSEPRPALAAFMSDDPDFDLIDAHLQMDGPNRSSDSAPRSLQEKIPTSDSKPSGTDRGD